MNQIILQIARKMVAQIEEKIIEKELNIEGSIPELVKITQGAALEMYHELIEQADAAIKAAKRERKQEGLVVERKKDPRTVITSIGDLTFGRTYYWNSVKRCYEYPVDRLLGIEHYERIDPGLSKGLVSSARTRSYRDSSQRKCKGSVSAQTVMNKIRKAEPVIRKCEEKRKVPYLHIDADEDHVALQHSKYRKSTEVPLVSIYEGTEAVGKRKRCKGVFHISEYGKSSEELWEEVLGRIEQRYDLEDTKIYVHGDGARWIKEALGWLPKSRFVLDSYHKNKYVTEVVAGCDTDEKQMLRTAIQHALEDEDTAYFTKAIQYALEKHPEREEDITDAASYLLNQMDGISIRKQDPEARNGGASEPHVSHVLSDRLSSRPKGWSKETLKHFAPILANGSEVQMIRKQQPELTPLQKKAVKKVKKKFNPGIPSEVKPIFLETGKHDGWYEFFHSLIYDDSRILPQ